MGKERFLLLLALTLASSVLEAEAKTDPRTTRVTAGSELVGGWEKPLIEKENNLKNYFWIPLSRPKYKYITTSEKSSTGKSRASRYIKPIHLAPGASSGSRTAVSAKIQSSKNREQKVDAALVSKRTEVKVKTYSDYNSGALKGNLESMQVEGLILR